ncbi:MAG: 23S rRNA (pseudouridine(1915)-N(3))-methyltransferase RlmH [Bacteroidetes bacterium]|nr:23S rRNA (pseudouridine(1915)-N(3))-methyltransferase RlmH [Bacteroidota bacterium]MBS1739920.1 23S rRNA (pseudouridine(1915)-N(3))-methyltransferase RlmH [Bacteroidota bacterium]MBS1777567.1 23S rRNA (pseudouridine(1915)-N(3))-methyltransferase RlmH [Bacteroidota bacterium]
MQIEIWSIGKENETYISQGIEQYFKKIRPYISVSLHIIQAGKKSSTNDPEIAKKQEEECILKRLQPQHYLVLLDERGRKLNSLDWARQFQQMMNMGVKTVVILIGGAFGVGELVKREAKEIWSLSDLVFPHQLVRLLVSEQVYRAFSILHNSPYHHT